MSNRAKTKVQFNRGLMLVTGMLAAASLASWTVSAASSPAQGSGEIPGVTKARLAWSQGKLPLSFEANHGQVDPSIQYVARGAGFGIYFTGQEAVLALHKPASRLAALATAHPRLEVKGVALPSSGAGSPQEARQHPPATMLTTDVIRMQLVGANAHTQPTGLEPLPGTSNYILGNDPSKWHTAIPNYSRIEYSGVYNGVDLVYYGNQSQLEYDFIVAPHADAASIRLRFAGASSLTLDRDGSLAIHAADGSVRFQKPVLYQETHGDRRPIAGSFKLIDRDTISFAIGTYDHSQPLVIDPILAYSSFFGGSNAEFAVAVTADAAGNAYVCGLTISTDFPLTAGAFQAVNYAEGQNAVSTAFVSKFDASGSALLYSTYLGGNAIGDTLHEQGDYAHAIAVDASGNAYVTGWTYSSDFPITGGAFQTTDQAANIALATGFVTKLNPSGTGLIYSTYLGGNLLDEPNSIAVDTAGDAYISGITFSGNFPVTASAFQKINNSAGTNGFNAFVTKLNPSGSALVYSTYLGGADSGGTTIGGIYWTNPIAIDKSGNAYVAGFTASGDYPVTSSAFQKLSHATGFAVTVTKLNPTGSALIYSTYLGGSTTSISEGLAVDSSGNAYVAGYTSDHDFPVTAGAFQTTNKASTNTSISPDVVNNGFITKLNPAGSALVYSTYLGGTTGPWGGDHIYALALDSGGHAYVTGGAMSADFPVTSNAYQPTNHGATHCCDYLTYTSNGFLTEMNYAGNGLIYSTYIGGSGTQNNGPGAPGDEAYYLALGPSSNVYVVGYTTSPNFPVTAGAFETKYHTDQNTGFVADFDLGATPVAKDTDTTLTASANPVTPGISVTFTAAVTPTSGTGIPTGNMVFSVDEATVGTVALNSAGKATYTAISLPPGAHYVLASYLGSAAYASSGDGFNEFIVPAQPLIAPAAGTYYDQQSVTVTAPTPGSVLYYTLDGTVPTVFSSTYTGSLIVNKNTTLNVIAVSEHDATSATASAGYTVIGSPSALIGPASGIATPAATLNAFVNDLGAAGTWYFRYGTSASALTSSTAKTNIAASTTRARVSVTLSALAAKTTYYFQAVVTTAGGTTTSGVASFTTN